MPQLLSDAVWWGGGIPQTAPVHGRSGQLWVGREVGGGGTPGFQARSERELVIPDRIPLDWSLEFECVCWGDFPQLSNPQP